MRRLSYGQIFAHLPELTTERLLLRRLKMRDAQDMFDYASDPQVSRYVLWDTHQSIQDTRQFLYAARRQYLHGEPGSWAIILRENGRMIGTIGIMALQEQSACAEVGYSLSRSYWNQGIMTEALHAVLTFCFDTLELNRVEGQHFVDNPASGRVMCHNGMQPEGVLRQRIFYRGQYCDVAMYSILAQEFRS